SIPRPNLADVKLVTRATFRGDGNGRGFPAAEGRYLRYEYTESGVSPMAIPGTDRGQHVAAGREHNEAGPPRYESATNAARTGKRVVLVPEVNYTGQFADFLSAHYRRELRRINTFGGQPFRVGDLAEAIEGVHQHVR